MNSIFKRTAYLLHNVRIFSVNFDQWNASLLNKSVCMSPNLNIHDKIFFKTHYVLFVFMLVSCGFKDHFQGKYKV